MYPERFPFFDFFNSASFLWILYDFIFQYLDLLPVAPSLLPFFDADTLSRFRIREDLYIGSVGTGFMQSGLTSKSWYFALQKKVVAVEAKGDSNENGRIQMEQ
ncbi:hypothetical protein SAMN05660413_02992 [Salegentibacter flavus]|uniref:Uncharacterized protein n=1 Tax=Salegentibacter flavus TaxID=287099 RepID=A0A1I5CSP8_9FLAO|nr:hypothetical protein SAMN05660413_02992 [Salegentibacter flavus]